MDDNLTIPTLNDALLLYDKPEIFNSDHGSQYTAQKFINTLVDNHITISMDSKVIFFYASCKSMSFAVKEYGYIDNIDIFYILCG